jgi:predicted ATP-grasp superfamily ATP-dependent carboligase
MEPWRGPRQAGTQRSWLSTQALIRNPAVVLNCEAAGIGIIHALCRTDIDIIVVERDFPPLLGRFSRFPKLKVLYRPWRGESLTETLLKLCTRFEGKGVVFPGTDNDLEALFAGRDRLSERYHVPVADHGIKIFDKNWQYELAERVGCPIPKHIRFVAGERLDVRGFRFPLIIKPASRAVAAGASPFRLKVLENGVAVDRCLEKIARDNPGRAFQIAEAIPGESDQLYRAGA